MKTLMNRVVLASSVVCALAAPVSRNAASDENARTAEALARGVFNAVRQGSFEALTPYLATADDFAQMIRMYPGITEEQRQEALSERDAWAEKLRTHFQAEMARAKTAHDWPNAKLARVELVVNGPDGPEIVDEATLIARGRPAAQVRAIVSLGGRERTLDLRDCFRVERGWVVTELADLILSQ